MKRSFLILHGWSGSGPEHWQAWLAERLQAAGHEVRFPTFPDSYEPELDSWLESLRLELESFSDRESLTVICHSLAVILWLHFAQRTTEQIAQRVILVAPPGPSACVADIATFFPIPLPAESLPKAGGPH